jgi:HSP20 family molecular chaperone IbpA
VPLPADADVEKVTATCKKGTLMIRVPKTRRDRPGMRRITVST